MSEQNLLSMFPQKKIKPYDGMPVTSGTWEQAHSYHNQAQQAHNLFFHSTGILIGLEVVASDPADNIVFILPGAAVDAKGRVIVLSEPVAYDLGDEIDGLLYLTISYRESEASVDMRSTLNELRYTTAEFLITARPNQNEADSVELARFIRESRTAAINDARNSQQPAQNEIDLRHRRELKAQTDRLISSAVVYLGKVKDKNHGKGLAQLAREAAGLNYNLVVDDDLKFSPAVLGYDLLCMVGEGDFKVSEAQLKGLQGYLGQGGMLLLEASDEVSEKAFSELAANLKIKLKEVKREHPLLNQPHLFSQIPTGFQKEGKLLAGGAVILSTCLYGRLWNGECSDRIPSREEIRSATELGINLLGLVVKNQQGI